jgi:subtilisin family serine protease
MRGRAVVLSLAVLAVAVVPVSGAVADPPPAPTPLPDVLAACAVSYPSGAADNPDPLAGCQWDMRDIHAGTTAWAGATGKGVRVGIIDSGIDATHPEFAGHLDLAHSCNFITAANTPADSGVPGDFVAGCGAAAVTDYNGHGTHVAGIVAAGINGHGTVGVAPDATLVSLKVCTSTAYCFVGAVADAIRYAGQIQLDVVNLSLFADPYLFYCFNDADQKAMFRQIESAVAYARQRGVLVVAAAGNDSHDLQHPLTDYISPDWPPGVSQFRIVHNNCKQSPTEIAGTVAVSATGPQEYPMPHFGTLAYYSNTGMSRVAVSAPGGEAGVNFVAVDYDHPTQAELNTIGTTSVWSSWSSTDSGDFALLSSFGIGITTVDPATGARYVAVDGTSMASPHAAGVAALIKQRHPTWPESAVRAALLRATQPMSCPTPNPEFQAIFSAPDCYGQSGRTSFFGAGLVDAVSASRS